MGAEPRAVLGLEGMAVADDDNAPVDSNETEAIVAGFLNSDDGVIDLDALFELLAANLPDAAADALGKEARESGDGVSTAVRDTSTTDLGLPVEPLPKGRLLDDVTPDGESGSVV